MNPGTEQSGEDGLAKDSEMLLCSPGPVDIGAWVCPSPAGPERQAQEAS